MERQTSHGKFPFSGAKLRAWPVVITGMLLRTALSAPMYKFTENQVNASITHCPTFADLI
jgi:hypothetical protein